MPDDPKLILLTGATGYVGGRLRQLLETQGYRLRCLARQPEHLKREGDNENARRTEIVAGDAFDRDSLLAAMAGVHTTYYLIHSMATRGSFEDRDQTAAENFAWACREAGVKRIIYLGGLGRDDENLSPHLRSRHEVGDILRTAGCQVIEFRASIVIGSGSLSFELVRALVQRLPVMICPRWVSVRAQPIAIEDLLAYLVEAVELPSRESTIYEIGGPDQVSYGEIMREYARQRGLKRWFVSVPVLTPRLSSLWLGLVTPVYAVVGRKLIDSLRNETVVNDPSATRDFEIRPRGLRAAIRRALKSEDRQIAETRWSDALSSARGTRSWGGVKFGKRIIDSRTIVVAATAPEAFAPIRRIGGQQGWYFANFLWTWRGWIDLLAGGVGRRRGRRDPEQLRVGEVLDWWRVERYKPDHLLRLAAEMKVPGRAWLEFEVQPAPQGTEIRQTAIFDPIGLLGLAYWYVLYPIHALIFSGMLRRIAAAAKRESGAEQSAALGGALRGPPAE
jgi:uncharacterized protein YbjT (DUF2867 family)